jgi:peroxiredoxin
MIEVGQRAPRVTFGRSDGTEVSLEALYREGPLVLAFLRHFG